jgi:hypothetical protein
MGDADTIPCEYCNMMISSNEYLDHNCVSQENIFTIDDYDDDDDCTLERYITSSYQLSGQNLRTFLNDHNISVYGSSPSGSSEISNRSISYEVNNESIGKGISNINKVSNIIHKTGSIQGICPICQDEYCNISGNMRILVCSHIYCDACIMKWLKDNKKCPICQIV